MVPDPPARTRESAPIGAILAGGSASRLGGGQKGLLRVGGSSILERVLAVLRVGCKTILLNANGYPDELAGSGLALVPDTLPDRPGPLAGVLATMEWVAARHPATTHVVTAPGDTPFLPRDLVARLTDARRTGDATLACARSGGVAHPVVALWPVALRHELRAAVVDEGLRKVGLFVARQSVAYADWPIEPVDPFFNVNTPEDIAQAEAIASRHGA